MPCEEGTRSGEHGGKWRLLNPLSIRFSQPRIAPHFRDGHLLEEALPKFYESALESAPVEDHPPEDAATGQPPYDTVLVPPFPAIRVISWRPKIRNKDGEAERDAHGEQILGKRAWFALDNRRLHSMQCAAAKRWPRRCCVVVRCIEEVPGTTIRELRKFRTTTQGRSVEVGVRVGQTQRWAWPDAAPAGARWETLGEEGPFAEDLWDAPSWAPRAAGAASEAGPLGSEEEADHRQRSKPQDAAGARGIPEEDRGPKISECPASGWQYVDPSGTIQGPFALEKMRLWHEHGFFYPDLPMRCDIGDRFVNFAELFPAGTRPFADNVLRHKQ